MREGQGEITIYAKKSGISLGSPIELFFVCFCYTLMAYRKRHWPDEISMVFLSYTK